VSVENIGDEEASTKRLGRKEKYQVAARQREEGSAARIEVISLDAE
jgi:hypothetical protein